MLSLATFNVQGLSKVVNQHQLGLDCSNYSLDVIAPKETKIKSFLTLFYHVVIKNVNLVPTKFSFLETSV